MSAHGRGRGEELACRALVEVVTDYLEGAMPPADRRRFEAHLEECPFCTEYVEQMRTLASGGLAEPAPDVLAEGRREDLLAAFRDWREKNP
jgi:anti-sigma factor RsiW